MSKKRMVPKLPKPEQRRPELVHEHRCVACGYLLGTTDLNDSSHVRAFVRAGQRGPVATAAMAAVRAAHQALGAREGCPCGAIMEHVADDAELAGTRMVDRSAPIVDTAEVIDGRLVLHGRFLEGAVVKMHRGPVAILAEGGTQERTLAVAPPPWTLRRARADAPRALELALDETRKVTRRQHTIHLDAPLPPLPGSVVVLTLEGTTGSATLSVAIAPAKESA